jgi:hypothetical protein
VTRGDFRNAPGAQRPDGSPEDLEHLEELGDDAIIAQQTAAHAPVPRQNVSNEARSVVISDRPGPGMIGTQPGTRRRGTTEKTVIIRDRRKLDEVRQALIERQVKKKQARARLIYFWGAIGIAAFVLGGVVALFATGDGAAEAASAAPPSLPAPVTSAAAPADQEPPTVDLSELPVEKRSRKKK